MYIHVKDKEIYLVSTIMIYLNTDVYIDTTEIQILDFVKRFEIN